MRCSSAKNSGTTSLFVHRRRGALGGNLDAALSVYADGTSYFGTILPTLVWTGVGAYGAPADVSLAGTAATTCQGWSSNSSAISATVGIACDTTFAFAADYSEPCGNSYPVYCFEQ
jgi:hypothetical protein